MSATDLQSIPIMVSDNHQTSSVNPFRSLMSFGHVLFANLWRPESRYFLRKFSWPMYVTFASFRKSFATSMFAFMQPSDITCLTAYTQDSGFRMVFVPAQIRALSATPRLQYSDLLNAQSHLCRLLIQGIITWQFKCFMMFNSSRCRRSVDRVDYNKM